MITAILNRYGWKENAEGTVAYEGFEHLLNPEIPDWRTELRKRALMQRSEFLVIYLPFETSDMTLEVLSFGKDEDEALKEFKMLHPAVHVKSVTKR